MRPLLPRTRYNFVISVFLTFIAIIAAGAVFAVAGAVYVGNGTVFAIAATDDVIRIVDVFDDDLMSVCVHLQGVALEHSDIVNIGLHFFLKDVRPMLPPVMNHSIAVA